MKAGRVVLPGFRNITKETGERFKQGKQGNKKTKLRRPLYYIALQPFNDGGVSAIFICERF